MKTPAFFSRFLFPVIFSAVALAAGCAQKEEPAATPSPAGDAAAKMDASPGASPAAGAAGGFKVSLITVGSIADKGWSQTAYDGLKQIKDKVGADTTPPVENPGLSGIESTLRNMAHDGSKLVIANGSEFDDAAKKVAPDVPNTTISIIGGRSVGKNLMPIEFEVGQATYLAGMVAGSMTKTNKVACVGPVEIPIIKDAFASFTKGVKAVNPKADVKVTFTGSEDIAKAKQQAQALLDSGCDVIMGNANDGNNGVAQAVSDKEGAMFIGANSDQSDLATPKNLGSFILDVPNAMTAVATNVKDGRNIGKAYSGGVTDKVVYFKFNPGFKGTIPDDVKKKVDAAIADMSSGKLIVK